MALKAKPLGKIDNNKLRTAMAGIREERQRLNVDVPASHYKALKIKATQEGVTISDLVNQWVESYIKE